MKCKRDIDDLISELNGLSALLTVMSGEFMEDQVTDTTGTIGDALFGLSSFCDHIAEDFERIAADQARGRRNEH